MSIRVYFNRCFSSTSKIIQCLQSNPDCREYKIYITHGCDNLYLKEVADHFEVEPVLQGKEYVDFCLNFCLKHQIDIFVPRYNATILCGYKDDFEKIGVKVMFAGSAQTYQVLENKLDTYNALKDSNLVAIPKTFCVRNYNDFAIAFQAIKENGSRACLKPLVDIGGSGFKRILEDVTELDELYRSTSLTISKQRIERILRGSHDVTPFILMEYLEEDEFSIDCLASQGELIVAIPRRKLDYYRQSIERREDLIAIACRLTRKFKLSYLFNIQLKYHQGCVYLLEINTRMSGGIHKSSLSGINFLYLALKLLMKEEVTIPSEIRWNFQLRSQEYYQTVSMGTSNSELLTLE